MQGDIKGTSWGVFKAILPIIIIVLALQFTLLGLPSAVIWRFLVGAVFIAAGLILFLLGVKISIIPMGEEIGSELPQIGRLGIILFWTFLLGFTATLAEPPVHVLASMIEEASEGNISRVLLVCLTALGIGLFVKLAVLRIVLQVPLVYLFALGYTAILVLSFFTPSQFVAISFDASGVTTGPVTVPVILSLGVGMTSVLGGKSTTAESFGLIGLASIGPILAVMLMGVILG